VPGVKEDFIPQNVPPSPEAPAANEEGHGAKS
jgi:hypothetical protein